MADNSSGYFIEHLLSRADVKPVWDEFVYHPFVMGLGDGTLPLESFKGYIIQDYLYLVSPFSSYVSSISLLLLICAGALFASQRPRCLQVHQHQGHCPCKSNHLPISSSSFVLSPLTNAQSTEIVNHIAREMELHIGYCKTFGISESEIQQTRELQGTFSPILLLPL